MNRLLLLPLAAAAAIACGCGEARTGGGGDGGVTVESAAAVVPSHSEPRLRSVASRTARGLRIKAVNSDYGRVVADGRGEALYLFDKEGGPTPRCYGACAAVWPPLLVRGKPSSGAGLDGSLLGSTRRRNGQLQVTYGGHPLYYYVGDSPGAILCHDVFEFGGTWLVVGPNGRAVS